MRVVFLALGANRRLAVTAESRALAEAGGQAVVVVLVKDRDDWADENFAPGVELATLNDPTGTHWPVAAERMVLYRIPGYLIRRLGAVRGERLARAYERQIAHRVHRGVFLPLYRRVWRGGANHPVDEFRRRRGPFDAVVVTDPLSFPVAQRLARGRRNAPRIAFRIDQILDPAASPGSS